MRRTWVEESPLRDRMIFLVGAQRSGTNWLQRIIAAHPNVVSVPSETELFSLGIEPLTERFHHGAIGSYRLASTYVDRGELLAALRRFCDTVFESVGRALAASTDRVLERTPDHVRHLELISEIYPDAWFVHIIRDGRDVARSLVSQSWGPTSIAEAAERWRTAIESARSAAPGIERYREVRYENLLSDPRAVTEDLFTWLDLERSETVLEQALAEARFTYNVDPSDSRITEGKWQATFSDRELEDFLRVAGPLLAELGYETTHPSIASEPVEPSSTREPQPSPPATPRALVKRAVTGLRKRTSDRAFARDRLDRAQRAQEVFDHFLELVAARRFQDLRTVLHPLPRITIVDRGQRWEGTGPMAVERLVTTLESDDVLGGRQSIGDAWPGLSAFALITYVTEEGSKHDRAFVLYIEGRRIARLAYYRFPLDRSTRQTGGTPRGSSF